MAVQVKVPVGNAGEGSPSLPLHQKLMEAAVNSAPENPRDGHGPSDSRPASRAKVTAAWLHCVRLSAKSCAETASELSGTKVTYAVLRWWRTQPDFVALVKNARAEIANALTAELDRLTDLGAEFERFANELVFYHSDIANAVLDHAEKLSDTSKDWLRQKQEDILFLRWVRASGGSSRSELRQWTRERFPLSEIVETARDSFVAAEAQQDWKLAAEAFNLVERLARDHAAEVDAKTERAAQRQEARWAKEDAKAPRVKGRKKR